MGGLTFLARIKVHFIAVVGGLVVAFALIVLVEAIGHAIYPVPAGVDPSDAAAVAAALEQAPVGSLLFVLLGWTLGTACGAWIAARLVEPAIVLGRVVLSALGLARAADSLEAGAMPMTDALVVGTILLFAGAANLIMLPHPTWFTILGVMVFLPAAWIGGRLATR